MTPLFEKIQSPHLEPKPWGGHQLAAIRGRSDRIGESWEISTFPGKEGQLAQGALSRVVGELPYMVKILETTRPLSVQVHPDDQTAQQLEGQRGKSECWFVMEAGRQAGVYLGTKEGVALDDFFQRAREGLAVEDFLQFFPAKKGDFFSVPAGTIHAIGGDLMLAEVQQSSGITYRIYDWGRERELHLAKARQAAKAISPGQLRELQIPATAGASDGTLIDGPHFRARLICGQGNNERKERKVVELRSEFHANALLCLKGQCGAPLYGVGLEALQSAISRGIPQLNLELSGDGQILVVD